MEVLADPCNDRVVKDCEPIAHRRLARDLLFSPHRNGLPDCGVLLAHLKKEGRLHAEDAITMIRLTTTIFTHEANVIRFNDPVTIVGDLHGQFYDLLEIMSVSKGNPPHRKFLFLGDYVDRGSFSTEILLYLYALKLNYPREVFLLRGNHEARQMSQFFNFRDECKYKYPDVDIYDCFMTSFDALPLAAIVNNRYLCVHGGISPDLSTISQIYEIDRFVEPPDSGLLCDLLWSDPDTDSVSRFYGTKFRPNDTRGCSYYYTHEAVCEFLEANNFSALIRAHEVQEKGFRMHAINQKTRFPAVITLFSAPNYCDVYGNRGAIANIDGNSEMEIIQFDAVNHPYHLPNFMDVFAWSVPFVCEKISEILHAIIHPPVEVADSVVEKSEVPATAVPALSGLERLKAKAKGLGRVLSLMKSLRQQREEELVAGSPRVGVSPNSPIPPFPQGGSESSSDESSSSSSEDEGNPSAFPSMPLIPVRRRSSIESMQEVAEEAQEFVYKEVAENDAIIERARPGTNSAARVGSVPLVQSELVDDPKSRKRSNSARF